MNKIRMYNYRSQTGGRVMPGSVWARQDQPRNHTEIPISTVLVHFSELQSYAMAVSLLDIHLIIMAAPSLAPHSVMWLRTHCISTAKLFFSCMYKNTFVKLCRMCFVKHKIVTPGEQSVAKLSFERVWVSTLLNGSESSPCMPDRLYIKLSQEPWGLEKYPSIAGPIGQWSLTHASFNITVINKGRKQIPKTWPAATAC